MYTQENVAAMTEYRLILILPGSRKMLAISSVDGYRLPSVRIPQWTRPAEQLQKATKAAWDLHVIVLDFLYPSEGSPVCAVAEVLLSNGNNDLMIIELAGLSTANLEEQQRKQLELTLACASNAGSPFTHIGWIDEAIGWFESETGKRLLSKSAIQQYNAGGHFSLVRFHTEDNCNFWLKATGEPNLHEYSVTTCLAKLDPDHLPTLISTKPAWNAWLMSGEATQIPDALTEPAQFLSLLEDAVESMAELQMKVEGNSLELLDAGAFDQGMEVFEEHSEALFDYLEEAMSLQSSTKVARLPTQRLQEIRTIFDEVCDCMDSLSLPETLVHGDLNRGNILTGVGHCQFIDWCEVYLGNPLITLQNLLLLNKVDSLDIRSFINQILKQKYRNVWAKNHDPTWLDEGFLYMPLLAIASTLYGRGDWLNSPRRNDPRHHSYARTLARCMDRAAREPELLEALCH
jgi:hypothetical protein